MRGWLAVAQGRQALLWRNDRPTDTEDDLEVDVGDVVRYVYLVKPSDVLTVQITDGKDDFTNGIVHVSRPLAQTLLGAVIGDEVVLHLPGTTAKNFLVKEIIKRS